MEGVFTNFINPYLNYIDEGKLYRNPFSWLYAFFAIVNLLVPIYILYQGIQFNLFDMPAETIASFLLTWVVVAFVSWLSFQIWWNRRSKVLVTSAVGDDFVATPTFSHFLQTFGEW